ncbi:MAG: vitamin transporter [Acidobacteriota bacterium]|jgi:outer membrane cobalamin receptor|nr:vitamin transporter [Acidobacteriota bacterium]
MTPSLWLVLWLSMTGAADPPAAAEPVVTVYATTTVRERPVDSATAAVTVLDRAALEESGAASVQEALAFVPGVTLVSGATRGGLTAAQIRGGDPNFTRVLIDGVPVNDGTYQIGEVFDLEALPASAVERVEVVRGPLSAYYGSTGLSGAIQVITRRGDGPLQGEIEAAAGNASYRRAAASLGGGDERAGGFASLLGEEERERIADERYRLTHFQGQGRVRLAEGASLRLAGRLASWHGDDYPDASGGPIYGSGELRRADHEEGSLGAQFVLDRTSGRLHQLSLSLYRHDLDRDSPAIGFEVPASVEATRFTRSRAGWVSSWTLRLAGLAGDTQLSVGADVEREEGENRSTLFLPDFLGGAVPGDYARTRTTRGVYSELIALRNRLTLEMGLRADFPEDAGRELSPRLGLGYRLGSGDTRLRVSLARAFKLPSFFALASPRALGGNPDLRPEESWGGDLGISHRFPEAGADLDVNLFLQRYKDLVDFDFETFSHVNRSRVRARGAETALTWRPRTALNAAATLTWQEVEDADTGQPLRHRPRWSGSVRAGWQGKAGFDLAADLRFVSASVDEQIPVPERHEVDGYALLGAAATWRLGPRWRLTLRADNLTNKSYETLIGFPGAGRSGRLSLRWTAGGRP